MMVRTKCSKCDSEDTHEEWLSSTVKLDETSKLIDENRNHYCKIERYITLCNICGQGCQIIDLDDLDRGKVNIYQLTKKSKTDKGKRKFIPNNVTIES